MYSKKAFKPISVLLVIAILAMIIAGCAPVAQSEESQEPAEEQASVAPVSQTSANKHLNIALHTYIEGMDPAEKWCGWNLTRTGVGETLVTVDENTDIVGQLADEWEQVDEVTYRFHIRQGVKFSNGNDMTPEIVKASIERTIATNARGESLKVKSIEADGEYVVFTTTEPFSAFVANLTEPMCTIVDTTADMSNYASKPICTGPYYVTEYVSEEKIELAANEHYWGTKPQVQTITALNIGAEARADAILAGDIDIAQAPAPTTLSKLEENDMGIVLEKVTGTREEDVILNMKEGHILQDVYLRKALSYAVNRDAIAMISSMGYAAPLGTPFPESAGYGYDEVTPQTYDESMAKQMLADGGYTDTDGDGFVEKNGVPVVLTLTASSGTATASTAIAEALQDMWKSVGINVEIELVESVMDKREAGDFDMMTSGWQTLNAGDGQKYLNARYYTDETDNFGKYSSEMFDEALRELDTAFDPQERVDAFVVAQQILVDDVANIWLYAGDNVTAINSTKVDNITAFPIDYYFVTSQWTIPG